MLKKMFCTLALIGTACASQVVSRGTIPEFSPNEGLIALGVDTDKSLATIDFVDPATKGSMILRGYDKGRDLRLLQLDAGTLCVYTVNLNRGAGFSRNLVFRSGRPPCFEVQPGKLSYVGHLVIREEQIHFQVSDRVAEDLEEMHPGITKRHALETNPMQ